jgi:hypothetical protein
MYKATADRLEKVLFTTTKPDAEVHRCVVVMDKFHAITSKHGAHSTFKARDPVTIYNVLDQSIQLEVCFPIIRISF